MPEPSRRDPQLRECEASAVERISVLWTEADYLIVLVDCAIVVVALVVL
jgi:hypothetical protein